MPSKLPLQAWGVGGKRDFMNILRMLKITFKIGQSERVKVKLTIINQTGPGSKILL